MLRNLHQCVAIVGLAFIKSKLWNNGIPDEYWLKVTKSNSHAKAPAAYYVDTLKQLVVCPKLLHTDCGPGNVLMATIQSRLQTPVDTQHHSSSVANIRIENWWSYNRKGYTGCLINFFKDMAATGEFNLGSTLHMSYPGILFHRCSSQNLIK